jgi:hypothetical protein
MELHAAHRAAEFQHAGCDAGWFEQVEDARVDGERL